MKKKLFTTLMLLITALTLIGCSGGNEAQDAKSNGADSSSRPTRLQQNNEGNAVNNSDTAHELISEDSSEFSKGIKIKTDENDSAATYALNP